MAIRIKHAGCVAAYLLQDERLAKLGSDLGVGSQPVVDEAAVEVLPIVRPEVDGGKIDVLAHLQAHIRLSWKRLLQR